MKNLIQLNLFALFLSFILQSSFAQDRDLQYYRYPDKRGINTFETTKDSLVAFEGLKVIVGGSSSLQFQGLQNSNNADTVLNSNGDNVNELRDLTSNFNLPTANLDLNVQLARGLRSVLVVYLSSRHHHEAYVKGGYLQVDRLDFISQGLLDNVMDYMTLKIGHMENNFGDAHFRRSDNSMVIYNPFVENYILDAFTTEVGAEVYYQNSGWLAMFGVTNGKLNQSVTDEGATGVAVLGKLGYDKQLSDNLRLRLSGSIYHNSKAARIYLYSGDRAGSRYYSVMESMTSTADNFTSGRWNPNFADQITAIMINTFIKFHGFEIFGTYERPEGGDTKGSSETRAWDQFAIDGIYRFGRTEDFYVALRYNTASGKMLNSNPDPVTITRVVASAGWWLTDNVMTKFEYVNQTYNDFPSSSIYSDGEFNGFIIEAGISF